MGENIRDVAINMRVYNNQLRQRRLKADMNYRQLAEAVGVSNTECCKMERVTYDPIRHNSVGSVVGWKTAVTRISKYWAELPEDLFPEVLRTAESFEAEITTEVSDLALLSEYAQHASLSLEDPDSPFLRREERGLIDKTLETLHDREAKILRLRFEEDLTLTEIGRLLGVSGGRVGQLEAKALRKLRHPSRSRALKGEGPVRMQHEIEAELEALRREREEEEEEEKQQAARDKYWENNNY